MKRPDQRSVVHRLRDELLDQQVGVAPSSMLDCAGRMLLYFDDPVAVQRIGLQHLLERFSATRVDIGFGSPNSLVYRASVSERQPDCNAPDMVGHELPNLDGGIQVVWRSDKPVLLDVENEPILHRLRPAMRALGVRTKLARRLEYRNELFGIVCIDQTEERRAWDADDQRYFDRFVLGFLAPIAAESRAFNAGEASVRLTGAELAVVRLAATGLSYKEIAAALGKSSNTVDNQLRQIRCKLAVRNQVELVQACVRLM